MSAGSLPYLSSEWISAADALLRDVVLDPPVADAFSIETCVLGGPDGDRRYVLEFSEIGTRARASTPDAAPATVRLTQRYDIAAAVAQGELSAQAAFLAADIQVGGDVSTLIAHAGLIAQVGDVLASLRADTVFDVTDPGSVPS